MTKALKNEAEKLTEILVKNYKPEKIILFGSVARGEEKNESDLDLFIVKETDKPFFERLMDVQQLLQTKIPLDILVLTPSEFKKAIEEERLFIRHILKYGKILYESATL